VAGGQSGRGQTDLTHREKPESGHGRDLAVILF